MRVTYPRAFCLAVVMLAALSPYGVYSQSSLQNRTTISGFVFGPERSRIEGATVELVNEVDSVLGRTRTDGAGRFTFGRVPPGLLSIRVLAIGPYERLTRRLESSEISEVEVYLKPRKSNVARNGVIFAQEIPEAAKEYYEQAVSDLASERVLDGTENLKKALAIFPTYYYALDRLGREYIKQQKFDDARELLQKAVELNSRSYNSAYSLSYANLATGKYEAAVEAATKALVLDKNSSPALFVLGVSQRRLRLFEDAERSLLRAQAIDRGATPEIGWNLALLYAHNLKRHDAAADQLDLILRSNPDVPNAEVIKKLIKQFRESSMASK